MGTYTKTCSKTRSKGALSSSAELNQAKLNQDDSYIALYRRAIEN